MVYYSRDSSEEYTSHNAGTRTMLHPLLLRWFRMNDHNFVILAWHTLYSMKWSLQVQCPEEATDAHKYMPQTLDELELYQWHPEVKDMILCCCSLLGMGSHHLVFVTMPKRWYKIISLKDTACHLKQLKQYTFWSIAAEWEIKELKKGAGHKLLRSRAP